MNTELLRVDELPETADGYPQRNCSLLRERLIEERDKNARLEAQIDEMILRHSKETSKLVHVLEQISEIANAETWVYLR